MSFTKRYYESQRENLIENANEFVDDFDSIYQEYVQSQELQKLLESNELQTISS